MLVHPGCLTMVYVLYTGETEAQMMGSDLVRAVSRMTDVARNRPEGPLPLLAAGGFTH